MTLETADAYTHLHVRSTVHESCSIPKLPILPSHYCLHRFVTVRILGALVPSGLAIVWSSVLPTWSPSGVRSRAITSRQIW
jgi:hypothetical protein